MDARNVKETSKAGIAKKKTKQHINDEDRQQNMWSENKVNRQNQCKAKNNKAYTKAIGKNKLLLNGTIKSTPQKKYCEKYVTKQELINSSILDSASISHSASAGLCRFACSNCSSTFASWKSLQVHEKNEHSKSIHRCNVEAYLFKASVHICQICSKKMLSDASFLTEHFRKKHNVTLSKYRQQYNCNSVENIRNNKLYKTMEAAKKSTDVIGNLCTFRCPGCKKIFHSKNAFLIHCNSKVRNTCQSLKDTVEWQACIEEVVTHKCKICFKLLLCDNGTIVSHVRNCHDMKTIEEYARKTSCTMQCHKSSKDGSDILNSKIAKFTTQIGNFCTYTCHDCDNVSENWGKMRDHMKTFNHGSTNSAWHQYITKVVLHQCKVCKQSVLNDCQFLVRHINHHHQISVSDYKKLEL